jgi:NAD(P)-dependent dehydrogenase (short-subunit alcohol dehydrogenase family)
MIEGRRLGMGELDGATAIITGGSRGIGLAAARGIGLIGATVVLVGQDADRAEAAAESLQAEGIDAVGASCDVGDHRSVAAMAMRLGPLGEADILVASAGVMSERMSKTLRTTEEEWQRVMSVNLDGVFNVMNVFGPGMVDRRRGRIIAVSACLGRFSGPGTAGGLAPYRVSKAAVNALVKNLAAEMQFGKRGVLVDAMCPNHCRTDMGGPEAPRSAQEGAQTIVWLASRQAMLPDGSPAPTGLLWEDCEVIPW